MVFFTKNYGLFYKGKTAYIFYIKNKIISLEFIPLSTVEEKGAQNNKDVCGIQNTCCDKMKLV